MYKSYKRTKFVCDVLDDSIFIVKSIGEGKEIKEDLFKKYLDLDKKNFLHSNFLSLFLKLKNLYFFIKKHKLKLDNEILFFLSEIINCLLLLREKNKSDIVKAKVSTNIKNLNLIRKGIKIEKSNFLKTLKFDSIYLELEEIFLLIMDLAENNQKGDLV